MVRTSKRILVATASAAGLALLVAAGLALRLVASVKPRVAATASEALGMDVTIDGALTVGVRRGLHFALSDVRLRRCGVDVGSIAQADLGIALLPLLHREIRIEQLRLTDPRIRVERDGKGDRRPVPGCPAATSLPTLALARLVVSGGTIRYTDTPSGKFVEASRCEGVIRDLHLGGGATALGELALAAQASCGEVRTHDLAASEVTFTLAGHGGVLDFSPVAMQVLGGHGSGTLHADFTGATPRYRLQYRLTQFQLEDFFNALAKPHAGHGALDFAATLSLSGTGPEQWLPTLAGDASLRGTDLHLAIGDLDQKFSRYESSQNFSLVDVGAVFFLGPIGLGITKGLDFARNLQGNEGETQLQTLLSEWQVERGIARATDAAMTTRKNRIALRGSLDFVSGRFDDVTVALVDGQGCAQVRQRVSGPFLAPKVEPPNVLRSLTGPTRRLLGQVGKLLGAKCEVFYSGAVAPPVP
jgi:uncharacterized protein involved in outer membrane biogenesis